MGRPWGQASIPAQLTEEHHEARFALQLGEYRMQTHHEQPLALSSLALSTSLRRRRKTPALASLGGIWASFGGGTTVDGYGSSGSPSGPGPLRKIFMDIDLNGDGVITESEIEAYAAANGLPTVYAHSFVAAALSSAQQPKNCNSRQRKPVAPATTDPQQQTLQEAQQPAVSAVVASGNRSNSSVSSNATISSGHESFGGSSSNGPAMYATGHAPHQPSPPSYQRDSPHQRRPSSPNAALTYQQFNSFVRSREEALRRAFDLFDRDGDGKISVEDMDASLAHVSVVCPRTRCVYKSRRKMADCLLRKAATSAAPSSIDFAEFRRFFMLVPSDDQLVSFWMSAGRCPDMGRVTIHDTSSSSSGSPWGHLLAGAVAGATSRTVTAPLETLRLAAMAGTLQSSNLVESATSIVEQGGWRALYRGNLVNVLRSAPQKGLDFFAFDAFKKLLGDEGNALKTFIAAGLAGATSCVALYPLEVVRSRITVDPIAAASFKNPAHAVMTIARREGPLALYNGLGPSVAAIIPEAAICYGLHDTLKNVYRRVHGCEPGVLPSLTMGVASAFIGQMVAFPLEAVSRRLQVSQTSVGPGVVLQQLLKEGGPRALYRGVGAATLRLIPMACVSFGSYELCRSLLLNMEQWQDQKQADEEYNALHACTQPLSSAEPVMPPVTVVASIVGDAPAVRTVASAVVRSSGNSSE